MHWRDRFKYFSFMPAILVALLCASVPLSHPAQAQELAAQPDWINNLNVQNEQVLEYVEPLIDAQTWLYTAPYLEALAQRPASEQLLIAQHHKDSTVVLSAPLTKLTRNLRVPPKLRFDILGHIGTQNDLSKQRISLLLELAALPRLSRAKTNGFSTGEVAYLRAARLLAQLSVAGDLSLREFDVIKANAPLGYEALPQVAGLRIATANRAAAEARADAAEARAAETTRIRLETEARAAETTRIRLEAEAHVELALQVLEAVERAAKAVSGQD